MKVLIAGASGLVGTTLVPRLRQAGHDLRCLARTASGRSGAAAFDVPWNPETGELGRDELASWQGPDALIYLAGENIAARRWTLKQKRRIRTSRVDATQKLAASLLASAHPPEVFISASAIGYYGDRGDELLTEESPAGHGFMAETVQDWEASADVLRHAGLRVVHLRFGMILAGGGGALAKMLPFYRAGLGGPVGNGRQWISWISVLDAARALEFALVHETVQGVYNAVSPEPVRNAAFARELGAALHRPSFLPAPEVVLRALYGQMAEETLLSGQRVSSERLQNSGFTFEHRTLPEALRDVLKPDPYKN